MDNKRIRTFRKLLREFERLTQIMIAGCCREVTLAQCHVLLEIEESGETTTQDLAKNLKLDKSTMSRTLDSLVQNDLVNRNSGHSDRRYKLISLTEKGNAVCDQINQENDDYFLEIFTKIAGDKRDDVISHFSLLVQAIRERENESVLDGIGFK